MMDDYYVLTLYDAKEVAEVIRKLNEILVLVTDVKKIKILNQNNELVTYVCGLRCSGPKSIMKELKNVFYGVTEVDGLPAYY